MTRVLGIDEGSNVLGAALLEGERAIWTRRISASGEWSWRRRMTFICDVLHRELFGGTFLPPDVIGIEDVALFGHTQASAIMNRTVGWLTAELGRWYPDVPIYLVNPQTVRAHVAAPAKRAGALERYKVVARHMSGREEISEDEAAAVCVAWATHIITGNGAAS